jgi:methylmalonyl-CoA mutase cobalamin-binding domain/chain
MRHRADDGFERPGHDECLTSIALPALVALGRPPLTAFISNPKAEALGGGKTAEPGQPADEDSDTLFGVIESSIIPRLMLVHQTDEVNGTAIPDPPVASRLEPSDHDRFLEVVRFEPESAVRQIVGEFLERGVPRPVVFVELLGTAARRLGELWTRDECTFADVTIGLCRLHAVLREESTLFDSGRGAALADRSSAPRRILLATADGDQHILGTVIVAEFFRQAGWHVTCEPGMEPEGIAKLLAKRSYDILGLSITRTARIHVVRTEIDIYRKASSNPCIGVLVGGHIFELESEMVERLGADESCLDARIAPKVAEKMISKRRLAIERADGELQS